MAQRKEIVVPETDPVVVTAQRLVRLYLEDAAGREEVDAALRSDAADPLRRRRLAEGLAALRTILDVPVHSWYLAWIVEGDANRSLPEFTERAAREFLEDFAAQARDALDGRDPAVEQVERVSRGPTAV